MRPSINLAVISVAMFAAGCSPQTRTFPGAPFPELVALTCDLRAVHVGVLNPTYQNMRDHDALSLRVAELDATAGTAQLIGNNGASKVRYERDANQLRFFETTTSGNLTTLSIFAPPGVNEPLPAVHSRHIQIVPGDIAFSQYAGSCKAKS